MHLIFLPKLPKPGPACLRIFRTALSKLQLICVVRLRATMIEGTLTNISNARKSTPTAAKLVSTSLLFFLPPVLHPLNYWDLGPSLGTAQRDVRQLSHVRLSHTACYPCSNLWVPPHCRCRFLATRLVCKYGTEKENGTVDTRCIFPERMLRVAARGTNCRSVQLLHLPPGVNEPALMLAIHALMSVDAQVPLHTCEMKFMD